MTAAAGGDPRATVVIVNWNGEKLLPTCLDAVAAQTAPFPFQTWVVDNASRDGSVELLRERYPWVRVLRSGANKGFAGGNNHALRTMTTPYAVLLNNDATPEPDWLENLLAPFEAPGGERLGAVTGKVVFEPTFLRLRLSTAGFVPGPHDARRLGVRVSSVRVDGAERLGDVLWEKLTWGAEGPAAGRFFWTRPAGELLVPVPAAGPVTLAFTWAAERAKPVTLGWDGGSVSLPVGPDPTGASAVIPPGVPRVDVVNNVGGIVLVDGYGADRGYQEVDTGRYDTPEEVFTACGNGVALRTRVGRELGWFDEDFFLYYEDTDLSWRLRARGWSIRYEPTAVLRHLHSATSGEWSPLFVFHTDRNRLLMLTKNATPGLALRAVLRYPLTTASTALRALRRGLAARRRPAVRPTLLRLRVIGSYLRLLVPMLRRRRVVRRTAALPRRELERRWLVPRPPVTSPTAAPAAAPTGEEPAA